MPHQGEVVMNSEVYQGILAALPTAHSLAETLAKSVGVLDSLSKSTVAKGLGVALPPFVGSMGSLTKSRNKALIQADSLERYREAEFLVEGSIASKILFITDIGEQNEDAETYDFTMKIAAWAVNRAARIVERMGNTRVVVKVLLIGEV